MDTPSSQPLQPKKRPRLHPKSLLIAAIALSVALLVAIGALYAAQLVSPAEEEIVNDVVNVAPTPSPSPSGINTNIQIEAYKPVVYLYPEERTDVTVSLAVQGEVVADYPAYDVSTGGWQVTAFPSGQLVDHADGQEYSYLFWEADFEPAPVYDMSTGFVVRGDETREFLQKQLAEMGMTPAEYNEFIVYWYPQMQNNPYNLIHFAQTEYTGAAELVVDPKPDSMLRVFMVYEALEEPIAVEPQRLEPFERKGFSVVEWGGTQL